MAPPLPPGVMPPPGVGGFHPPLPPQPVGGGYGHHIGMNPHLLPPPPYGHHLLPPPLPVHPPPMGGVAGGVGNDDGMHLIPQAKVVGSELAVASSLGAGMNVDVAGSGGDVGGAAMLTLTAGSQVEAIATEGVAGLAGGSAINSGTSPTRKKKKKKRKKKKLLKGGLTLAYDPDEEDEEEEEEEDDGKERGGDCCMEERRARSGKYQRGMGSTVSGSNMALA